MRRILASAALAVGPMLATVAMAGSTPANPDALVYIVSPADGATVSGPVKVIFGLSGMGVAPAGTEREMTGHHHLIIDRAVYGAASGDDLAAPIPGDDHHKHFGGGQTETVLDLAPGTHTLQLVLGDAFHVPHDPPVMSEVVTITVK
ncbi:MAG: DUF4399 domain-containing protein [Marinibacterium sp.]